jgi:peptide/nickel transport system ATP-binding protein
MYAGSVVEQAGVRELFANPRHPYTRGLIRSLPRKGRDSRKGRLYTITGTVPHLLELDPGCKFFDRCPHAQEAICRPAEPALEEIGADHWVRCRRTLELGDDDRTGGA